MSNSNEYVQQLEQIESFLLNAIIKEEGKPVNLSTPSTLLANLNEMYRLTQENLLYLLQLKKLRLMMNCLLQN